MNNQDKNNQVRAPYSSRGCCGEPLCREGRLQPACGCQGAASQLLVQHIKSRVMLLIFLKKINILITEIIAKGAASKLSGRKNQNSQM